MAKGLMVVQSGPTPGREAEYDEWYSKVHLPEICSVPGFVGGRRFKVHGDSGEYPYLAVYEIETDGEITTPMAEWRRRSSAGETTRSGSVRADPPPIVTVYEEID